MANVTLEKRNEGSGENDSHRTFLNGRAAPNGPGGKHHTFSVPSKNDAEDKEEWERGEPVEKKENSSKKKHVKATPLPKLKMLAVAATLLTEAMCSTMLLPFVGLLVAKLKGISVEDAGYSSGVLIGLFMIGQIISTRLWGWMSDVYGRRPPLLMGLFAGALTMFFFGMSPNIYVCCTLRFIHGFFNGNILIAKVIIADITDDTNAAMGFSLIAILWSCGAVIGPIIGGFLYDPYVNPMLQGLHVKEDSFLGTHPAFLASLVIALYSIFNFFLCFFVLPETNMNRTGSLRAVPVLGHLLQMLKPKKVTIVELNGEHKNGTAEPVSQDPFSSSTTAAPPEPPKTHVKMTYKKAFLDRVLRTVMLVTMCVGFTDMSFVEVIPLWLIATTEVGGMGLFSDRVGVLLLLCSISSVIFNFFFPKIVRKINSYKIIWLCSLLCFGCSVVLTPIASGFGPRAGFWLVWVTGSLKNCSCAACFTVSQILVGQAAPPGTLGEVYGIAQTFGVLVRCVVPFLIAPLLAWSLAEGRAFPFDYHFTFWLSVIPLIGAAFLCWRNPIERSKEDIENITWELAVDEAQERGEQGMEDVTDLGNSKALNTRGVVEGNEEDMIRPVSLSSPYFLNRQMSRSMEGRGGNDREKDQEEQGFIERRESLVAHVSFLGVSDDMTTINPHPEEKDDEDDDDEGPAITMEEYRSMANSFASCHSNNFLSRMVVMEESREDEMKRWHRYIAPKGRNHHLHSAAIALQGEDFRLAGEEEEFEVVQRNESTN